MKGTGTLVLSALAGMLLTLLTGCSSPASTPAVRPPTQIPTGPPATPSPTRPTEQAAPTENGATLDLRYANVIDVEVEALGGNEFRFSVTLQHDDEGEAPNFADAWQVEDLEGNLLGTRELLHSHGNQPFTRSATITIPEGVEEVIVRGHDMTHGYGGQGMRVDLQTGATTIVPSTADR